MTQVVIVLATYNGAKYVGEQIASIRCQTFSDWTMLIRDDGSTDGTCEIIEETVRLDSRIRVVRDEHGNLGPIGNFDALLAAANEIGPDYVFLSDQDDVWLPDKISKQIECMCTIETTHGKDIPLLVHSDLVVVNASLRLISESFMSYQKIWHRNTNAIRTLLAQNFTTGCTMVVNRALLRIALPMPEGIVMHDWWLALCAAMCGNVIYLSEPTVLYRQHGGNQIGAKNYWKSYFKKALSWLGRRGAGGCELGIQPELCQAKLLLERVQGEYVPYHDSLLCLRRYVSLLSDTISTSRRVALVLVCGIRPQTALRTLSFYRRLIAQN